MKEKVFLQRCLKDVHGYCKGEPDLEKKIVKYAWGEKDSIQYFCKLDLKTCGKFLSTR